MLNFRHTSHSHPGEVETKKYPVRDKSSRKLKWLCLVSSGGLQILAESHPG